MNVQSTVGRRTIDSSAQFRRIIEAIRATLSARRHATAFGAALGAALVVLIAGPLAATLSIWVDEAFTLHTTGAGAQFAFAQAIAFEGQPPLYFVFEALWRLLDEGSIAFARVPSVLFAAGSVIAVVFAARRVAPGLSPIAVGIVTALNPIVLWAAAEMRVYALVLCACAVLTLTLVDGFLAERPSAAARVWYGIVAVIGLYTQYYIGFILLANALAVLALRPARMRSLAIVLAAVALAFAPLVHIAIVQVRSSSDFVESVSLVHALHFMAAVAFAFVLPHDLNFSGPAKIAGYGAAVAAAVALVGGGRLRILTRSARGICIAFAAAIVIFTLVFGLLGLPSSPQRHVVALVPLALLFALVLLDAVTRCRRFGLAAAAVLFAVFAGSQLWWETHSPGDVLGKPGDWQRVGAALASVSPQIPIAVFPAELSLPLAPYLQRDVLPLPRPLNFSLNYIRASAINNEAEIAHSLDPVRARAAELWLVTSGDCPAIEPRVYNYHCRFLETYVNEHYRLVERHAFRGTITRLFERRDAVPRGGKPA